MRLRSVPMRVSPDFAKFADEMNMKYGSSTRRLTDILAEKKYIIKKLIEDDEFEKIVQGMMRK